VSLHQDSLNPEETFVIEPTSGLLTLDTGSPRLPGLVVALGMSLARRLFRAR
jgi:hypothetical protein